MERTYACTEVRSHLPLFAGGELEAGVRLAVERHLELCPECAREDAAARAAREALRSLAWSGAPSPDLWPGVRAELVAAGQIAAAQSAKGRPPRAPRRTLLLSAAAAVLLLAGGVMLGRSSRPDGGRGLEPGAAPSLDFVDAGRPPRGGVRPVALRPLDPSEWPAAEPRTSAPDPFPARPSDGQAAGFHLGIH